ncbi:restriction endonuclease subunit S [Streptosporangium saharense]|uniref:restriction endonuclease subunit S n=1 Tax=Streptosporangium saharense TaxID=1706840 RepID=UPI003323240C
MTDLPLGWELAPLGDLGLEIRDGVAPQLGKKYQLWSVPSFASGCPEELDGSAIGSTKLAVQPGDILICKINPRINRVWVVRESRDSLEQLASPEWLVLRIPESVRDVTAAYLRHYLSSPCFRNWIIGSTSGATGSHTRAKSKDILQQIIPIPPIAEQRHIVDTLEDLLSRLNTGMCGVRNVEHRLKLLAKRIIIESVPVPGPDHWKLVTVADAGKVELGRQRHPDWHTGPHMRPYLRVANVFEDRIDVSDLMEMDFPPDTFNRFRLLEGDILLNEGQSPEYLGRPAMYRGDPPVVAFTNSLLRFQSGPDVLPEWALLVFRRHMHARRFIKEVRITTNIAHLSASRLKTVEFPIPPIQEQREIVATVHEQLDRIAQMSAATNLGTTRSDHLRQALLLEAFTGRLVPNGPEDEPASVLLERIKTERATLQTSKRRARRIRSKAVMSTDESHARPEAGTRPIIDIPAPSSTTSKGTPVQETLL